MNRRLFIGGAAGLAAPIPEHLIDRYGLDPCWYGRYLDAWGLPVFGPHRIRDATLVRLRDRLGTLLSTHPYWPVHELDRRDVRLVVVAHGQKMSAVPEVRRRFGTELDVRRRGGFGATDTFPLTVTTEGDPLEDFVREFGRTLHLMALRYIDPSLTVELDSAYQAARRLGLWLNTYAATSVDEYFDEGIQVYFGVNHRGPVGGDGLHNHISTRAALKTYDRPLYTLFERLYRGRTLPT